MTLMTVLLKDAITFIGCFIVPSCAAWLIMRNWGRKEKK